MFTSLRKVLPPVLTTVVLVGVAVAAVLSGVFLKRLVGVGLAHSPSYSGSGEPVLITKALESASSFPLWGGLVAFAAVLLGFLAYRISQDHRLNQSLVMLVVAMAYTTVLVGWVTVSLALVVRFVGW